MLTPGSWPKMEKPPDFPGGRGRDAATARMYGGTPGAQLRGRRRHRCGRRRAAVRLGRTLPLGSGGRDTHANARAVAARGSTPPRRRRCSKRIVLRGVHFDFDKSAIRPDSRPVLDEAVDVLKENPNVRIAVEGNTDNVGSDLYNEKLSVRRAEAVFRYLVNHGIAPERMEVIGYGESRPVADNDTESGRAQNRRVELHVVDQPRERNRTVAMQCSRD